MIQNLTQKFISIIDNDSSKNEEVNNEFNNFLNLFENSEKSSQDFAFNELISSFVISDTNYLQSFAAAVGILIEHGYIPTSTNITKLIQYYEKLLTSTTKVMQCFIEKVSSVKNEDNFDEDEFDVDGFFENSFPEIQEILPNETNDWLKLEETYCCGIALFSLSVQARKEAHYLRSLTEPSKDLNSGSHWFNWMLSVLDNEPFIAIERELMTGFKGKMSGVVDNFQLHTLLQGIFQGGWNSNSIDTEAIENAKGFGEQSLKRPAKGKWNMYDWTSVQNDLTLPGHNDLGSWIWGEGKPEDIPIFDGYRVIILGKATVHRTWNAQRAFGKLKAELKVEETLSRTEILELLKKMPNAKN